MNPTRNDLDGALRKKVIALLEPLLAGALDLSTHAKQAHWNVKGPSFASLHLLFDAVYEHASEHVDEIAERMVEIGGVTAGTVRAAAKATKLPEYPLDLLAGRDHVDALAGSVAAFAASVRRGIDEATKLGDAATADLFTEIVRALDKDLWMLEAHLQD